MLAVQFLAKRALAVGKAFGVHSRAVALPWLWIAILPWCLTLALSLAWLLATAFLTILAWQLAGLPIRPLALLTLFALLLAIFVELLLQIAKGLVAKSLLLAQRICQLAQVARRSLQAASSVSLPSVVVAIIVAIDPASPVAGRMPGVRGASGQTTAGRELSISLGGPVRSRLAPPLASALARASRAGRNAITPM